MFNFSEDSFQTTGQGVVYKEQKICLVSPSDFLLLSSPEKETRKTARSVYREGVSFNTLPLIQVLHEEDILGMVRWSNGRHRSRVLRDHYCPVMPVLLYLQRHRTDTRPWPTLLKAHPQALDPDYCIPFPAPWP